MEGVERVSLKAGLGIEGVSAIVGFSSHHAASMAKKVLVEGRRALHFDEDPLVWQPRRRSGRNELPASARAQPPHHRHRGSV